MSGVRIPPPRPFMVAVAQLVERRIVTPVAAGSIPVSHPILVLPHSPRKNPLLQRWGRTETAVATVANAHCRRVFLPKFIAMKSSSYRNVLALKSVS
jgi:hypothetical protein